MFFAASAVKQAMKVQEVIVRALRFSVLWSIEPSSGPGSHPSSPPSVAHTLV
jgi:hypothetical protein